MYKGEPQEKETSDSGLRLQAGLVPPWPPFFVEQRYRGREEGIVLVLGQTGQLLVDFVSEQIQEGCEGVGELGVDEQGQRKIGKGVLMDFLQMTQKRKEKEEDSGCEEESPGFWRF
jgi:hypothetical protein